MKEKALLKQTSLEHAQNHIHVAFHTPHLVISSAVLNGGIVQASHLVNLRVQQHGSSLEAPERTLAKYCADAGWSGTIVGMMTAASMDSFRIARETVQGIDMVILVTSGLSNPRRVGDHADYREMMTESKEIGTINIIAMTSAILTEAAMVEALTIVTEAKSAALQEAGVKSPVSNKMATGTGTDSIAVVSGHGPETVRYCGKHVLFGEMLGRLATNAVKSSIAWDLTQGFGANAQPRQKTDGCQE
jgi:adenosylcobinamide amidohydrolase